MAESVVLLEELVQRNLRAGQVDYWAGIVPSQTGSRHTISKSRLRRILRLFQVNYLLLNTRKSIGLSASGQVTGLPGQQRLYPIDQTALATFLPYRPRGVTTEMFRQMTRRILRGRDRGRIFVRGPVGIDAPVRGKIELIRHSGSWDQLAFRTDTSRNAPILIRMAWSPGWRASKHGTPLVIQPIFPGVMLINSYGEFQLSFGRTLLEKVAAAISVTGIVLMSICAFSCWPVNRCDDK